MTRQIGKCVLAAVVLSVLASWACAAETNLLPNGGFEVTGRWAPEYLAQYAKQTGVKDFDPLLPIGWIPDFNQGVTYEIASDAHGGKKSLKVATTKNAGGQIAMQAIEVAPGGTYTFGLWCKGKGKCEMRVVGLAYEGRQNLAYKDIAAQPQWTRMTNTIEIPGHIRMVRIEVYVSGDSEVLLDDVFFGTELDRPFDADAVLTTKPQADADTIMLLDFDGQGPETKLEKQAAIVDGGRFGKCLRLDRKAMSVAKAPLNVKQMPPEGTLEFWMTMDEVPQLTPQTCGTIQSYLQLYTNGMDVVCFHTSAGNLSVRWMGKGETNGPEHIIQSPEWAAFRWFRKGQWNHVAMEWDAEAVRLYVNGALVNYEAKRPLPFFATPTVIEMGPFWEGYSWSGGIDEVRLSSVKRYGPKVPKGVQWVSIPVAADTAPPPPPKPPADAAAQRAKLIGTIPDAPPGAIVFDATRVKPLVQDDLDFAVLADTPVKGMTVAKVGNPNVDTLRLPDTDGGFWPLNGVQAVKYYVGIWYECEWNGLEAPQGGGGRMFAYLNGRSLQLSTHSKPVQVAPGVYYAEAQSKAAESIKDGDEIEIFGAFNQPVKIARLTLYPKEPARGHGWMFENYGANWFSRDCSLRLGAFCGYRPADGKWIGPWMEQQSDSPDSFKKTANGKALAFYQVSNPLPVPLTVKCKLEIRAYYREIVGTAEATIDLKPHERVTREVPFTIISDSSRYSMEMKVNAVNPPSLGWPTVDTVEFFKGIRQSIPWPDVFNNEFRRSILFGRPLPGVRQSMSLNGQWDSALTLIPTQPPIPPPAGLKWEARGVPFGQSFSNQTPQPHAMYLRRKVTLPEGGGKRTWRLLVTSVTDAATAYVNGQKVGELNGVLTPMLCDITSALVPGENEITLVVRDGLANTDPAYVNPKNPVADREFLVAPGSGQGAYFSVSGVKLLSSPLVTAEDLLVITSVRKKQVTANFTVTNREKAARKLKIKTQVLDAGKPVMDLDEKTFDLAAGANKPVSLTSRWSDPVFWGPGSPKLYTLLVETSDAFTGEKLDVLRERFGFRESWVQDGRIMFNGAPVRLKGSNCFGGGGLVGADDCTWSRQTSGQEDYLDEYGGLAGYYMLGGLGNTPSRHNIENDSYWKIETQNVLIGARLYMNHPCILDWDLSNEWLSYVSYGGGDAMFGARRFKAVGDALMALDPSRWILYDGDGDLYGLWNTFAGHYCDPYPGEFEMRGHTQYPPDNRFWRELDKDFKDGLEVQMGREALRADKVLISDTENAWKVSGLNPPGLSHVAGEDDILSPALDAGRGSILWYWKQNIDGHRDAFCSIICNYTTITGLNRRGHMLQCFIMPEHSHHYFSGQKLQRRYSLHNDLFVPAEYDFHWGLLDADGKTVTDGHDKRHMDSGDLKRGQLSLDLPEVKERTLYTLRLDLLSDGKLIYNEDRDMDVWSQTPPAVTQPTRKISLYDPSGKTAGVFKKAGIEFTAMEKLAVPDGKPSEAVLVLGEGSVKENMESAGGALSAFTSAGGRVVALMQEKILPGLPVHTTLEPREWCSMTFLRTPQHPILKGLSSWDVQFWAADHVVGKGSYSRPDEGSFVPLIDGAGDYGRGSVSAMEWNQLLECYRGQGSYLLCQLPLIEKYDVEPMAREMLARIVGYEAGGEQFLTPLNTLKIVGDSAGAATKKLGDMGVSLRQITADAKFDSNSVVLLDAATLPAGLTAPAQWKDAMEQGATLIVHGATPAQKPLLEALAGKSVDIAVQPYSMWEGRGCRSGFTWLTPGLSQVDLYWKDHDDGEGGGTQAESPKLKIEDLCYWSVAAEGSVEHVYPGALIEIPVGKGKLIVDQIRWDTTNKKLDRLGSRIVSAIMAGLNVAVAPYVPPKDLPPNIIFKPVDLSFFCNRGFKDEVGNDGKGGWPDQGPKLDLHAFPTGDQNFGGVPFSIGKEPRTCIVLKSASRPFPELYPDEVTIPLGFPVEGLSFLHSTSWGAQAPTGLYQIQYADGTTAQIVLVENENIFGWTHLPAEFPRERGTRSRVAWTGTSEIFPNLCVCQMLWVNPKPDVAVKAVRFSNPPKNMCPVLIAMTAAVKPGKADLDAIAAAQSKARDWLKKAVAAVDAGKDAEARTAVLEALKADPKLDAAHQRLCELEERGHDEKAAIAAYKAWAAAGARTPLPYNKIGEILERQGDLKGALEAYTKSLEVEWNQPPIIEAKSRLTLQLKK